MLRLVFASSSDFTIPILNNILESQDQKISDLALKQIKQLDLDIIQEPFKSNLKALQVNLENNVFSDVLDQPIELALVITQAIRLNRGKEVKNPIYVYAESKGVPILAPEKLNVEVDKLTELNVDIGIVASYGQILSSKILASSKYGMINWHPSLLPKYRGPTPMQTALVNGDEQIGLSWIEMTRGMDAGDILLQTHELLNPFETIAELSQHMGTTGSDTWAIAASIQILNKLNNPQISENLDKSGSDDQTEHTTNSQITANSTNYDITKDNQKLAVTQNPDEAVFCTMLDKEQRYIDYTISTAAQIFNHWRAYQFFPGTILKSQYFSQEIKLIECDTAYIKTLSTQFEKNINLARQNPLQVSGMLNPNHVFGEFYKDKNQVFIICSEQTLLPVRTIQLLGSGQKINLSGYNFKN